MGGESGADRAAIFLLRLSMSSVTLWRSGVGAGCCFVDKGTGFETAGIKAEAAAGSGNDDRSIDSDISIGDILPKYAIGDICIS